MLYRYKGKLYVEEISLTHVRPKWWWKYQNREAIKRLSWIHHVINHRAMTVIPEAAQDIRALAPKEKE